MRNAQFAALSVVIVYQLVLVSACQTPVPPTVTRAPMTALKTDPAVFLQATAQRPRIVESLRSAGVRLAGAHKEADYTLNVDVGRQRGARECGGTSNVVYVLGGRASHLMVIKGRGLTGACVPNIFDAMSQELASYFGR